MFVVPLDTLAASLATTLAVPASLDDKIELASADPPESFMRKAGTLSSIAVSIAHAATKLNFLRTQLWTICTKTPS